MEVLNFDDMGLKQDLLTMIGAKGFKTPTPIQIKAIPIAMAGHDVMGQAQTGTGKTAAFGIPILNNINKGAGIQTLILCPTRELTMQVCEEIAFLGKRLHINALAIYGGQSIDLQIRGLQRQPEIIVATPGRMLDHIGRNTIKLAGLRYVVIDEADEMLDMGFLPDVETILSHCPLERHTFLFSATLIDEVREMGRKFMKDPEWIAVEPQVLTVPKIDHCYFDVNPRRKVETLCRIIDVKQPTTSLIFCRTRKNADQLAHLLETRGYSAESLHGDMSQRERDNVMNRFRRGIVHILVATDLAARGLDVDLVTHVFNFDLPEDPDVYIHRTGRTGRAGRFGEAIALVEPAQRRQLRIIEKHIDKQVRREVLPTLADAMEGRKEILTSTLLKAMDEPVNIYQDLAGSLCQNHDALTLLAAALKLLDAGAPEFETADLDGDENSVHVELPLGRFQGLSPRRLVDFLTNNTSLHAGQIGDIEIQGNTSYVEVPMQRVDEVYEAMVILQRSKKRERVKRPNGQGFQNPRSKTGER